MVFYIRFLKSPRMTVINHTRSAVKALITITSDLGENIYQGDLSLRGALVTLDEKDALLSESDFLWKQGMRSLWIGIDQKRLPQLTWPVQMVVAAHKRAVVDIVSLDDIPEFVSAWSDSFDANATKTNSQWVMRRFEPTAGVSLNIREETGDSIARHVWDGGIALAACLSTAMLYPLHRKSPESLKSLLHIAQPAALNVIELGSGCGLVGITFAAVRPKCHILLTDLPEAMDILGYNISQSKPALGSKMEHMVLDWDDTLPPSVAQERYDLVLVSECTYNDRSIPALVRTLSALAGGSRASVIVVATKVRHCSEAVFFDLMSQSGFVEVERLSIPLPDPQKKASGQDLENVDVYILCGVQMQGQPIGKPEKCLYT